MKKLVRGGYGVAVQKFEAEEYTSQNPSSNVYLIEPLCSRPKINEPITND